MSQDSLKFPNIQFLSYYFQDVAKEENLEPNFIHQIILTIIVDVIQFWNISYIADDM